MMRDPDIITNDYALRAIADKIKSDLREKMTTMVLQELRKDIVPLVEASLNDSIIRVAATREYRTMATTIHVAVEDKRTK